MNRYSAYQNTEEFTYKAQAINLHGGIKSSIQIEGCIVEVGNDVHLAVRAIADYVFDILFSHIRQQDFWIGFIPFQHLSALKELIIYRFLEKLSLLQILDLANSKEVKKTYLNLMLNCTKNEVEVYLKSEDRKLKPFRTSKLISLLSTVDIEFESLHAEVIGYEYQESEFNQALLLLVKEVNNTISDEA